MSKGFLIYVPNSNQKDIIDSTILSALSIKTSQHKYNNVALLFSDNSIFENNSASEGGAIFSLEMQSLL